MQTTQPDAAARRIAVTDKLGEAATAGQSDAFISGAYSSLFPKPAQPTGQLVMDRAMAAAGIEAALRDVAGRQVVDADAAWNAMMEDERIRKGLPRQVNFADAREVAAHEGQCAAAKSLYEQRIANRLRGGPRPPVLDASPEAQDPRGSYCRRIANAWKTAGDRS